MVTIYNLVLPRTVLRCSHRKPIVTTFSFSVYPAHYYLRIVLNHFFFFVDELVLSTAIYYTDAVLENFPEESGTEISHRNRGAQPKANFNNPPSERHLLVYTIFITSHQSSIPTISITFTIVCPDDFLW